MSGKAAARITDLVKHDAPHCHGGHKRKPHGPLPNPLMSSGAPTVQINDLMAATVGTKSDHCVIGGCATPLGPPGAVATGSATVMICGRPAARQGDKVMYGCGPGTIVGPCSATVKIG